MRDLPAIDDLVPWSRWELNTLGSAAPILGMTAMNPSIHFDGKTWRCVVRCVNYAKPSGRSVKNRGAGTTQVSLNVMLILDPETLGPIATFPMSEDDDYPRTKTSLVGFSDMRLFCTRGVSAQPVLHGIAASSHLERVRGVPHPPEQVVLDFDEAYNIVGATPIRGKRWNSTTQKNWSPFDGAAEPYFLQRIRRGTVFGLSGPTDEAAFAARVAEHSTTPRPARSAGAFDDLRGGTQLVYVGDRLDRQLGTAVYGGAWVSLAHDMRMGRSGRYYWHLIYACDDSGELVGMSGPFKLEPKESIEFAAGLAVDRDRAVISYGVNDMACRFGTTTLAALLALIRPIATDGIRPGGASRR